MQLNYAPRASSSASKPVNIKIVPGWVFRSFIRNKLTIQEMASYSKVRKVLSVDDLAELVYMNGCYKIQGALLGKDLDLKNSWWYTEFFEGISNEERLEFQNSVVPLSYSEETAESVKMRLNASNDVSDCGYQVIATADCIYLVLNEGFDTNMREPAKLAEFVEKYLQTCYSIYPVREVSCLPVYELYLQKLSVQG
jgi:hypothetical protein